MSCGNVNITNRPTNVNVTQPGQAAKVPAPGMGTPKWIVGEVPSGAVDGSNASFQSLLDFIPGKLEVFINGLRQKEGLDYYTTMTRNIYMTVSPETGDLIEINYQRP